MTDFIIQQQQQQHEGFNPRSQPSLLSQTIIRPGDDRSTNPSSSSSSSSNQPSFLSQTIIEPGVGSGANPSSSSRLAYRNPRIEVPQYMVNGGFNQKFVSDPYNVQLHGILTAGAYENIIEKLNDSLKDARAKKIDLMLFSMGAAMLPLIPWAYRHYKMRKLYKKILLEEVRLFNDLNPRLYMRWNRKPESCLTIELRTEDHLVGTKATGGGGKNVGSGIDGNDRFSIGSSESSELDGNQLDMRPLKGNKLE